MHKRCDALKAAFPHTLPILAGFLFMGATYGVLMHNHGFPAYFSILTSVFVLAGSMQFLSIQLLISAFNPLYAFLIAFIVNARHIFYGISMLKRFKGTGKLKPYLIFGLCDETFSIHVANPSPQGVDKTYFMFFTTLLNHSYWVAGTALGALLGNFITFDLTGIDFAMTALFVTIFIDQWRQEKEHRPALIGVGCALVCLFIFGAEDFILPAMILILIVLMLLRKPIERGVQI